jgi:polyisoprenoid-binding protein YceI
MDVSPLDALPAPLLPPGRWVVDPEASRVGFRVRHFGCAPVDGEFTEFAGTIGDGSAAGSAKVASIDTGLVARDERLRSPDFFDGDRFPHIAFESAGALSDVVHGLLTIKDVTRPVTFEVDRAVPAAGTPRIRARATLSRKAFGLDWPALREAGRLLIGDRVQVLVDLAVVPAEAPELATATPAEARS